MKILNKDLYWIRSGFFTVLQNLTSVVISFGTLLLLVRLLTEHDYGVWILYTTTCTILEMVRSGLIQNALIKYLAGSEPAEHGNIITSSFAISALLTAGCIILILMFSHVLAEMWKSPEFAYIFPLYSIVFIITGITTQFNCIIQANLQFKKLLVGTFAMQGVFFSYIFTCFFFNIKLEVIHLIYVQMFTSFLGMSIAYAFARPYLRFAFKVSRQWASKLFNYGKYAFGTAISAILSVTIDQMMLGAILSPVATANFNIAVRITNILDVPTNAVAVIVFPKSAQRMETEGKGAIKYLYEKSVGTLLAILLPGVIFLYIFSGFIIDLIAPRYADAIPLLHITLLYCLMTPYGRQFGNILDSIGKTRLTFFIVLTVASLNIGLNYVFISSMGVMGAAYATFLSSAIGMALGQYILKRELDVSVFNTLIYAVKFYPEFFSKYIRPLRRHYRD